MQSPEYTDKKLMNWIGKAILPSLLCFLVFGDISPASANPKTQMSKLKCLLNDVNHRLEAKAEAIESLTPKAIQAAITESLRAGMRPKVVLTDAGKFIFYPTLAPLRILSIAAKTLKKHGLKKGLVRVPFEYIKQDGTTVLGFALFTQLNGGTPIQVAEYFLFPTNRNGNFEEDTKTAPRTDGILVYVDAVPDHNILAGYGKSDFDVRFSDRDDAYYIHTKNVSDMMRQLRSLSLKIGQPIAELEILGHGFPGLIGIGDEPLASENMDKVSGNQIPFAKNATIRLQSCLVGANSKISSGKVGDKFMSVFGSTLLNHGGTVIASNHVILVTDHFPKNAQKYHEPWMESYRNMALEPLEAAMLASIEILKTDDGRYRKVRIPAP
jgi:hypothetical protein